MDFQIDPNNLNDAMQLIEFANHLKKIHHIDKLESDEQTSRIQEAIDRNLNSDKNQQKSLETSQEEKEQESLPDVKTNLNSEPKEQEKHEMTLDGAMKVLKGQIKELTAEIL